MTVLARSLDRRSQVIIRELPGPEVQTLDRRTQLVFRLIEFVVPPVIPEALPYLLRAKEKLRAMNATDFNWTMRVIQGYSPDMIVAKLRGASFKVSDGRYIPIKSKDRNIHARARRDVAGWLGFSSIGVYQRTLKAEGRDIFERRRS